MKILRAITVQRAELDGHKINENVNFDLDFNILNIDEKNISVFFFEEDNEVEVNIIEEEN